MKYADLYNIFRDYCYQQGCKVKVVGDMAYRDRFSDPKRIIRFKSAKNGIVKVWDSSLKREVVINE